MYEVREWWKNTYLYYALKVPLESDRGAVDVNVNEAQIMGQVHCTHLLPLVEKRSCVSGKKLGSAFVTKLVPGDLHEWSQQAPEETKKSCLEKNYDQIYDGLECFHKAGFVHGDIKGENIL